MIRNIAAILMLLLVSCSLHAVHLEHTYNALQDVDDNVYFSTHDGVIRYDGHHYLNMNELSDLPRAWTIHIAYHKPSNSIYVAYDSLGIWRINLVTMTAIQVSTFNATKLAVSDSTLFAIAKRELASINLESLSLSILQTDGLLFDVAANSTDGYALSDKAVYMINYRGIRNIRDNNASSGSIIATPVGAIYSTTNALVSFTPSSFKGHFLVRPVKDVSLLTFSDPYGLFFVDDGFIHDVSYLDFMNTKSKIPVGFTAYRDLLVDSQKRLWAIKLTGFDIFSPTVRVERLKSVSKYNVISQHNNAIWHGVKNGLFIKTDKEFERVNLLDEVIKAPNYNILAINGFWGGTVVSTSVGSYFLNSTLTSAKKIFDGYVINASVIDGVLYLATDEHGVITFNELAKGATPYANNEKLPSQEVLSVRQANGLTYISTQKGLVIDNNGVISLHFENAAAVADTFMFGDVLYAATYGDGLHKYVDNKWRKLPSPDYITQLLTFNGSLVALTKYGLHKVKDNQTVLMDGTQHYGFIPNSVISSFKHLLATTEQGLVTIFPPTVIEPKHDAISYVQTQNGTILGEPKNDLALTSWINIGMTDYDYGNAIDYFYQYRVDGEKWHSIGTPLIQFDRIDSGKHEIEYRKRSRMEDSWSTPYSFSFVITPPWYLTVAAKVIYLILLIAFILFVTKSVMSWVQSFHRVFTANQRLVRKEGLHAAVVDIEACIGLSGGNATMQTEALVKLHNVLQVLTPIANDAAALGSNTLDQGLLSLQTQCIMKHMGIEVTFDVSLGNERLDHNFECEVYAVVYHAVLTALETKNCAHVVVHVNKVKHCIVVDVTDDGDANNRFNRVINFNLGDYVINQIAKSMNVRCNRSCSRNGNKMTIKMPVHLVRGPDRRKKQTLKLD